MQELYEFIFKRKSVRKFDSNKLNDSTLREIDRLIKEMKPLNHSIRTKVIVESSEEVGGLFAIKAPHYLLVYSESAEDALVNVGYMLQQMDLKLSEMKLGCCWLGMAKPSRKREDIGDLDFVIALAIGTPNEAYYRSLEGFNRKPISAISEGTGHNELIEAVRVAPSATNSQPWYIKVASDQLDVYRVKNNPLKALVMDRMNQIDIGIALCHLHIAAKAHQREAHVLMDSRKNMPALKGYEPMYSVKIKS